MVETTALVGTAAVFLISLALFPNLGFYTVGGMLAVLVVTAGVVAICLRRGPGRISLARRPTRALLFAPCLAAVAYQLWCAPSAADPWHTMGHAVLGFVAAVMILSAWVMYRRRTDGAGAALIGVGCLLTGINALAPQLRFGQPDNIPAAFVNTISLAALLAGVHLTWLSFLWQPSYARHRCGWLARWGVLLALGGALRVLAVTGSPAPVIDVHTWLTAAPEFLLAGQNPYRASYPSPYGTERAARFHIPGAPEPHPASYPPGVILSGVPAGLLGCDARYTNVLADVLAGVALLLVGWRARRPDLGVLASALYMCLPRVVFMVEQAWYEPQLAACVGLLALWLPTRPWAAGLALGGLLSLKQYALLLLPAVLGMCRRHLRVVTVGAAVAVAVTLPFLLWDAGAFWQMVVTAHWHRPVATHALCLPALLHNEFGWSLPRWVVWPFVVVLLLALGRRAPEAGKGPGMLWLAASLLVFNVFIQGFANYYYLAEYLLLLGVAQSGVGGSHRQQE